MPTDHLDVWGQRQICFKDLQRTQDLEERVNEAAAVLKLNISVVSQLRRHYLLVVNDYRMLSELKIACEEEINGFASRLGVIEASFDRHILRLDALLHLLQGRKALVRRTMPQDNQIDNVKLYGLLDFRNTQASQSLARISQDSAQSMEDITRNMRTLARKTKTETVSMKIITLVTLFFLPGTFISVCRTPSTC